MVFNPKDKKHMMSMCVPPAPLGWMDSGDEKTTTRTIWRLIDRVWLTASNSKRNARMSHLLINHQSHTHDDDDQQTAMSIINTLNTWMSSLLLYPIAPFLPRPLSTFPHLIPPTVHYDYLRFNLRSKRTPLSPDDSGLRGVWKWKKRHCESLRDREPKKSEKNGTTENRKATTTTATTKQQSNNSNNNNRRVRRWWKQTHTGWRNTREDKRRQLACWKCMWQTRSSTSPDAWTPGRLCFQWPTTSNRKKLGAELTTTQLSTLSAARHE